MTEERITIAELGAYTNNSPNREGIKKLVGKVNTPSIDAYTKAETDALLDDKQDVLTAGTGITIENDVISGVDAYTKTETDALLDDKQDVLTAGTNITIVDGVISATGGGSEWKLLTTTDWSNIVSIVNGDIIPLKDFMLYIKTGKQNISCIYFKDVHYSDYITTFTYNEYMGAPNNEARSYMSSVSFTTAVITDASIRLNIEGYKINTTDGTITPYTNFFFLTKSTDTANNNNIIRLFYKD